MSLEINMKDIVRKAKDSLKEFGYSDIFLELREATKSDGIWKVKFEYTLGSKSVTVNVEVDLKGKIVGFKREEAHPIT